MTGRQEIGARSKPEMILFSMLLFRKVRLKSRSQVEAAAAAAADDDDEPEEFQLIRVNLH